MGGSALVSHSNGTRCKQKISAAPGNFFKAKQTAPKATPSVPPISTSTCNDTVPETYNHAFIYPTPKSTLLMMRMMLILDGA